MVINIRAIARLLFRGILKTKKGRLSVERISKILPGLSRETATPSPKIIEPTVEELLEERRREMGVTSLENTFRNFELVPGSANALAAFKKLAEGRTEKTFLLCYGGVGNGKIHLCEAAAITLNKRGIFCRVFTMDKIMSALKACMDPDHAIFYEELLANYSYAPCLIIDDIDGTAWAMGELEKIIRVRYRENLITILTTNLDLPALPERVVSRFRDAVKSTIVLNSAADYRPNKKGG